MFYKFSQLNGGIVQGSQLETYMPQGLRVYREPVVFANSTLKPQQPQQIVKNLKHAQKLGQNLSSIRAHAFGSAMVTLGIGFGLMLFLNR